MPTLKRIAKKPNRISIKRDGRAFTVVVEGGIALVVLGAVGMAYISHLFH